MTARQVKFFFNHDNQSLHTKKRAVSSRALLNTAIVSLLISIIVLSAGWILINSADESFVFQENQPLFNLSINPYN